MQFIYYIMALIAGLIFCAAFWPMVLALILLFSKDKPKKINHPKAK